MKNKKHGKRIDNRNCWRSNRKAIKTALRQYAKSSR